jgi:hypothetical protein
MDKFVLVKTSYKKKCQTYFLHTCSLIVSSFFLSRAVLSAKKPLLNRQKQIQLGERFKRTST